nr:hypothetical protein CFP56_11274 [Quercus suber]
MCIGILIRLLRSVRGNRNDGSGGQAGPAQRPQRRRPGQRLQERRQQRAAKRHGQTGYPNGAPVPQQGQYLPQQSQHMPQQGQYMPQQGQPMPQQGHYMPQQGQPMPQQGQYMPQQAPPVYSQHGGYPDNFETINNTTPYDNVASYSALSCGNGEGGGNSSKLSALNAVHHPNIHNASPWTIFVYSISESRVTVLFIAAANSEIRASSQSIKAPASSSSSSSSLRISENLHKVPHAACNENRVAEAVCGHISDVQRGIAAHIRTAHWRSSSANDADDGQCGGCARPRASRD